MANFNFNRVFLGGRLTADPEVKMTQSGTQVLTFTVAVNRPKPKEGDQQSDFITCVAWKERAEMIGKYFRKGSSIFVEGELQVRKWKDNEGNNRYSYEVQVIRAHFVDSKGEGQGAPTAQPASYMPDAYTAAPPQFEEMGKDDDLPF